MDPTELIKAIPEVGKALGPLAAAIPFTGMVKRMLGPAADEVAEMLRDQVRLYRYSRQLECIEKAEKMATSAGFIPKAVPPKILFPLLEGASMEADESLHDMWAALLANAASDWSANVRPSFTRLLQDMAPDEACLLQDIFKQEEELERLRRNFEAERFPSLPQLKEAERVLQHLEVKMFDEVKKKFTKLPDESAAQMEQRFHACIQSLESVRLIYETAKPEGRIWELSGRGSLFMKACRPPKKSSP